MRGQMTHLDPDVLAEFRAGLITGRRGTKVAAHVADCARCAAVSDQLAEVSALLAAVPVPVMPDGVAERLDTVLAAEAARRDVSGRAGGDRSRDRAADPRPGRHWGFRLVAQRVLAPAAAIAVLAAGGYGLSRIGGGPSSSTPASGTVAEPAAAKTSAGSTKGAGSRPAAIAGIAGSSTLGVITVSTDYQPATLRQLLGQQLRHQLDQERPASASTGPPSGLSARLEACVQRVTGGISPGTLVLVENAHYQGRPVTVIVASSGRYYIAWVLAPGCSATRDDVLARTTLPGTSAP
jgi:hypothetical protein